MDTSTGTEPSGTEPSGAVPSGHAPTGEALEVPVLIARKRDGGELTPAELSALVSAYLADEVDDAQMAALLMAGVIRGFTEAEAIALTDVLLASGDTVDLSMLDGPTVDKHSTGGVGDTTTLIVAPMLAAAGCQVAKLSGRGLGHTGGTLDKLEAIPGFRVDLSPEQLRSQVQEIGLAVAAATAELVPADKRLYALRDVTATVPSTALIASSVMSKKLAGGASHVLLDVKLGDGAFLADPAAAVALAELCVQIGIARGRRTAALVTDMSQPLSDAIGNALEVGAAIEVLAGRRAGRLRELSVALTAAALELTGRDPAAARATAEQVLDRGQALERFRSFVAAQGGEPGVADDPWALLPAAAVVTAWRPGAGHVSVTGCRRLGELAGRLGAGRRRAGDALDLGVGLEVLVRTGDEIDADTVAVKVHARSEADAEAVMAELPEVVAVGPEPVEAPPLLHGRVGLS
jgi:pyrimidine-nucleoside phosphorylase